MLGNKLIKAAAGAAGAETDENFNQTVLLLHGDGNQGATNFTNAGPPVYLAFKDNSDNNFPITVNGDAYGDNFGPYAVDDGYWSNYFDGTSAYLSYATNTAFDFGTGDATVEFWFNSPGTTLNYPGIISSVNYATAGSASIRFDNTGYKGKVFMYLNGGGDPVISSSVLSYNTWYHAAFVRTGTSLKLYINGILDASVTISVSVGWNLGYGGFRIGRGFDVDAGNGYYKGYLSNIRLTKGRQVYTSNFTVPSAPLGVTSGGEDPPQGTEVSVLTAQSNRFVDNSTNGFAFTVNNSPKVQVFNPFGELPDGVNGSGYFDGTTDYLTVPNNADFQLGTGDFTVDFWYYPSDTTLVATVGLWGQSTSQASWLIYLNNSSKVVWYTSTNGSTQTASITSSASAILNQWNHIAVVNSSGTTTIYINGVTDNTTASVSLYAANSGLSIGYNPIGGTPDNVNGYLSNIRILKGTAINFSSTGVPTAPATSDANTSLLTCQYAGSVRNVGFIDSGPYDFPITRVGNTTQGSFSPFTKPDGRWSNYFDGVDDTLISSGTPMNFGTGDFTFEMWIYPLPVGSVKVIVNTNTSGGVGGGINSNGTITVGRALVATDGTTTNSVTFNAWNHVAWVRNSGTVKIYINGVEGFSGTLTTNYPSGALRLGSDNNNSLYYPGYISNVRVSTTAVYTSGFTPSTSPLTTSTSPTILTAQSNRFLDNSGNGLTFTIQGSPKVTPFSPFPLNTLTGVYNPTDFGGSGYFDGSGDYLGAPNNAAWNFGTGDFTIEGWFYIPSASVNDYQLFGCDNGSGNNPKYVAYTQSGEIYFDIYFSGLLSIATSGSAATPLANQFAHIAVVRNSSVTKIYVNGVERASAADTKNYTGLTQPFYVGYIGEAYKNNFLGYISSFRVLTGTALYTSAFTPPTAPPTSVTNTSLLLNFTNAGIYDSTAFNNLETVGNAQISTSVKKFGTGSIYIPSPLGQKLRIPPTQDLVFGTSDFTIECWYYAISKPDVAPCLITNDETASFPVNYWAIHDRHNQAADKFSFWMGNAVNNDEFLIGTTTVVNGTWYYVAVTRSGSTFRLFVDGVVEDTGTSSASLDGGVAKAINIGRSGYSDSYMNGYIDDLRITKGYARYTANFDPPTKAFPDQ